MYISCIYVWIVLSNKPVALTGALRDSDPRADVGADSPDVPRGDSWTTWSFDVDILKLYERIYLCIHKYQYLQITLNIICKLIEAKYVIVELNEIN